MFQNKKHFEIAKAESRNGKALLERDNLEKELQEKRKELEEKEAQVAVKDGQIKRLEVELGDHQNLLERKEMHRVRQKALLDELVATLEENQARTEDERVLRVLQEQLDQIRQSTDSLQRQWSDAEQQLLQVAMTRDLQAVEEGKLRDGQISMNEIQLNHDQWQSNRLLLFVLFVACLLSMGEQRSVSAKRRRSGSCVK